MKPLTKEEIKFIKETGWTPTKHQVNCDEWNNTIFPNLIDTSLSEKYIDNEGYLVDTYSDAVRKYCLEKYNIDTYDLYKKCVDEYDAITLENDAVYLFYAFFTKEELEKLTDEEATSWLKDFKYYNGYRKWDDGNLIYVEDAISVYNNQSAFYLDEEGDIWWFERDDEEAPMPELFTKYEANS
jgi:hypothetical protein